MASWKPPLISQGDSTVSVIVFYIGLLSCLGILFKTSSFILLYLKPSKLRRYLHDTGGKPAWALVTGASDGIGKQFVHELAARGFNVVLHGRNPTKLAAVLEELSARYPRREFRSVIADASAIPCVNCRAPAASPAKSTRSHDRSRGKTDLVDFDAIATSLSDINLTVLINNAGGSPSNPVYQFLQDSSEARLAGNVSLNAVFPLILQSKLLPQLLRNSPALIMNIGSMSDHGIPMLASYAPSKVFSNSLTEIISRELVLQGKQKDVELLMIRVGEVCGTAYNKHTATFLEPDARTMARAALARVGCGRVSVVGYFGHALQEVGLNLAPWFIKDMSLLNVTRSRWAEDQRMMKAT